MQWESAMMGGTDAGTIVRELRIDARPEIVFSYLVDPARLVCWMGTVATLDPRPGGVFRLDYNGEHVTSGVFVEVDPPRRVVFTWGWEAGGEATPPGSSIVEFDLAPDGDGTVLRLSHRGLATEAIAPHSEGWDYFLPRLASVGSSNDPVVAEAPMAATPA
jgi:uncharacterized protein YndB with AHSA1/START domain